MHIFSCELSGFCGIIFKLSEVHMRKIFFLVAAVFLFLPVSYSYGFGEKGQDCTKCHTLSKDEASTLLKDMIPNLKVLDVFTSPVKGFWEVDLEANNRKGLVYVDFSKKYLISGAIISIKEKKNLSQERSEELTKVVLSRDDVAKIPLDDAVVMGDKAARHKVIVFDDPD